MAVGEFTRYLMAPRLRAAYRFDVRLLSRSRDRNPLSCSGQCIRTKIFRKPREQWGREYCNQNSRNLDKARAHRVRWGTSDGALLRYSGGDIEVE